MDGKTTTNLLLAIIAGVLLFGRDAMLSSVHTFGIVAIAIGAIFLCLWGITAAISAMVDAYRNDGWGAILSLTFLVMSCVVVGYAALLWINGSTDPFDEAINSLPGYAGGIIIIGVILVMALTVLFYIIRWILIDPLRALSVAGIALVAPIAFPVREWRVGMVEQKSIPSRLISCAVAAFLGLALWGVAVMIVTAIIFDA